MLPAGCPGRADRPRSCAGGGGGRPGGRGRAAPRSRSAPRRRTVRAGRRAGGQPLLPGGPRVGAGQALVGEELGDPQRHPVTADQELAQLPGVPGRRAEFLAAGQHDSQRAPGACQGARRPAAGLPVTGQGHKQLPVGRAVRPGGRLGGAGGGPGRRGARPGRTGRPRPPRSAAGGRSTGTARPGGPSGTGGRPCTVRWSAGSCPRSRRTPRWPRRTGSRRLRAAGPLERPGGAQRGLAGPAAPGCADRLLAPAVGAGARRVLPAEQAAGAAQPAGQPGQVPAVRGRRRWFRRTGCGRWCSVPTTAAPPFCRSRCRPQRGRPPAACTVRTGHRSGPGAAGRSLGR